ncbi:MAG: serine hydrolase, partial [Anaerovoracaceae bacterium]
SEALQIAAEDGNITALFERDEEGNLIADRQWSILPPFRACACVKSTARDMARYYQCLSNKGMIDGKQAIPAEAVELMVGESYPLQEKAFYCLGLNKRSWKGHVLCEHSGGLHGVSSEGAFLKDENYGFAVLCNQGDCDMQDVMWMLTNAVMERPLEEDQFWLHDAGRPFSQPEMLDGTFICHEGNPVIAEVYHEGENLFMHRDEKTFELRFCGDTWFQLIGDTGNDRKVEGRCRFLVENGKAWGVQVYTRIYQRMEE